MNIHKKFKHKRQSGVSLIEVLIALFVLSVGLMGVGAMLVQSIRFNHDSNLHGQALFLAMDMSERIRNNQSPNPNQALFYAGINGNEGDPNCIDRPLGCTAAQLRQYDGYIWGEMIRERLPAGATGRVNVSGTPNILSITISWNQQDETSVDGTRLKTLIIDVLPNLAIPGP